MPYNPLFFQLRYDIIGEIAGLLFAVLILVFMFLTKPKQSKTYVFLLTGTIISIFAIMVQIVIVRMASIVSVYYNRNVFTAALTLFLTLYAILLFIYFNYINLLSEGRFRKRFVLIMIYITLSTIYFAVMIYLIVLKRLFFVRTDGIDITHFTRFYCVAGIICCIICMVITTLRRKNISRIVFRATVIAVTIDVAVLILQIIATRAIFSAVTYVIPFVICYQLFHSNSYDEETGCQNISAFESRFMTNERAGRVFYIAYIDFPQLADSSIVPNYEAFSMEVARICRKIERISRKILMYRLNYGTFIAILETKERSDAENYTEQMRDILDSFFERIDDKIHYFVGACGDSKRFVTVGNKYTQLFLRYLRNRYLKDGENIYYFANGADFRDFEEIYKIEQTLMDIRARMDPDDERIICYAQPIYSVEHKSFRSAEALMRLSIDGKMIPPDTFIKVAEQNNCIHALTVIMMHKVCRAVEALVEEYDFDAVTINCSTLDFTDKTFYKEIMDIIHSYRIDQKMIRLEITESMMAENYDAVRYNMSMLNREGIQLYMDDFGTGYSNLERVVDVPVQTIKFDKSLLYKAFKDYRVDDIFTYMIDFFKKNGFVTLIEGVENEAQKKFSIDRGFDYIQGYHYAKPSPIENLRKYFDKKS